ncbi:MAG: hypothetical protein ABI683_10595 [Ginsengibacter sp.]
MKTGIGLKLKIIIALIVAANCPFNIFSQTISDYHADSLPRLNVSSRSAIGLSISSYITNKAQTKLIAGSYHLKTLYMPGFEAGPDYHIHFKKGYSLIAGLHGGAAARNFKLFIAKDDFSPSLISDVNEDGQLTGQYDFYASLPLWLEKRWFTKTGNFWNVVAGLNVRYYPIRYYGDGVELVYLDANGNQMTVLKIDATIGNNLRPWLNYNIGGGYSFLLRNNNYLQGKLLANFSGKKIVDGTYEINVSGKPQSKGTYSANLSYAGLSFSYIFTGTNKRLQKTIVTHLHAQPNNDVRQETVSKVLYKGNYFAIYLSPYMSLKAKTVKQSGDYLLGASGSSGIEAGGNYFINFNKDYSLIAGAHVGFSGRNFKLSISKYDFTPNLQDDIKFNGRLTKDYAIYLSAPVWVERRWAAGKNNAWNVDAGINVRSDPDEAGYGYDYGGLDVNGQYAPVLNMDGDVGNNLKPWINFNVGGGYSMLLSNYNFLRVNLIANFSATKVVNFNYTIDVSGKPVSTGTYSSNLSYVGLSFSYIFTNANRRLLKLYKSNANGR